MFRLSFRSLERECHSQGASAEPELQDCPIPSREETAHDHARLDRTQRPVAAGRHGAAQGARATAKASSVKSSGVVARIGGDRRTHRARSLHETPRECASGRDRSIERLQQEKPGFFPLVAIEEWKRAVDLAALRVTDNDAGVWDGTRIISDQAGVRRRISPEGLTDIPSTLNEMRKLNRVLNNLLGER